MSAPRAYDTTGLRAAVAAVTLPTWVAELAGLISTLDVWRRLKDSNAFGTLARQLSDAIVSANSLQQQARLSRGDWACPVKSKARMSVFRTVLMPPLLWTALFAVTGMAVCARRLIPP